MTKTLYSQSNELIFLGGIDEKLWIANGKHLSRNYRQGYRVYDSEGIAQAICAESIGGLGGYTGLYLVREDERTTTANE